MNEKKKEISRRDPVHAPGPLALCMLYVKYFNFCSKIIFDYIKLWALIT